MTVDLISTKLGSTIACTMCEWVELCNKVVYERVDSLESTFKLVIQFSFNVAMTKIINVK